MDEEVEQEDMDGGAFGEILRLVLLFILEFV